SGMRAVIQKVTKASVTVGGDIVGSINRGLCVLVGINRDDGQEDVEYIIRKILNTRLFASEEGKKWDKSVKDMNLQVLCVSQFTLFGYLKGNSLDFHVAMSPDKAKPFYEDFLAQMGKTYQQDKIEDGRFGAMMSVLIENDGPVTILLDSKKRD
ncbi:pqn-68, partial [Pristionchus pacificus]